MEIVVMGGGGGRQQRIERITRRITRKHRAVRDKGRE